MAKNQLSNQIDGEVINAAVAVKNAGDGLSKALIVDPSLVDLEPGAKGVIALEYEVGPIHFVPVKDAPGCFTRKADLMVESGTFIDDAAVRDALERQRIAIEEHEGVHRLPLDEPAEDDAADG